MAYIDHKNRTSQAVLPAVGNVSVGAKRPDARNFADLLDAVERWPGLSAIQFKQLHVGVRRCADIVARNTAREHESLKNIACDLGSLNATLFQRPAAAHNLDPRTFDNYITSLRTVLRHVGIMPLEVVAVAPVDAEWRFVLDSMNCTFPVSGLTKFAAWSFEHGVRPAAVDDNHIAAFEHHMATTLLHPDIRKKIGNLTKAWRRLVKSGCIPGGQKVTAPGRRKPYTRPFSDYPKSLQAEIALFERVLSQDATSGPFRQEGPARKLSASALESRLFSLRQALAAMVLNGREPSSITSLAQLVTEDSFELILTHFWEHAIALKKSRGEIYAESDDVTDGVTTQTAAIAAALILAAQYVVKVPAEHLRVLRDLARDVRPATQSEINPKTRRILNELSVPAIRMKLLYLPQTLMREAAALRETKPREAARLAMVAVAVQIELMIPLRIGNLTGLRLDQHLHRLDPRSKLYSQLKLPPAAVKNRVEIEWPIDTETGAMIATFLQDFRPLLGDPESPWLFPSDYREVGHMRSVDSLRVAMTSEIAERVGVEMHIHAFRAFACMLVLEDSPGAIEDLRLILGHKTLTTSQRYYAFMQPKAAAARLVGVMDRARKGLTAKPAAKTPSKTKRQSRHGGTTSGRRQ